MLPLAHGPVGCGENALARRTVLAYRHLGIDTFTGLHACTDLNETDLEDGGDEKLIKALNEADMLFPLSKGTVLLSEEPIGLIDSNIRSISKQRRKKLNKTTLPLSCETYRITVAEVMRDVATGINAITKNIPTKTSKYDVALTFERPAQGLAWIVRKLLTDIGLNVIHEHTAASLAELARITKCKLVIGLAHMLDVPSDHAPIGHARNLEKWTGTPIEWVCFSSPDATDISLKRISDHFDWHIQRRTNIVIQQGHSRVLETIQRFRPYLVNKLAFQFQPMNSESRNSLELLGMRIGNYTGWPDKSGNWHSCKIHFDIDRPTDKSIRWILSQARPDVVLSWAKNEYEWAKHGQSPLRENDFYYGMYHRYWGYDGFALLAAGLHRSANAPWRKLIKAPWSSKVK